MTPEMKVLQKAINAIFNQKPKQKVIKGGYRWVFEKPPEPPKVLSPVSKICI